jgi:hypothetical protein
MRVVLPGELGAVSLCETRQLRAVCFFEGTFGSEVSLLGLGYQAARFLQLIRQLGYCLGHDPSPAGSTTGADGLFILDA